LVSIVLSRFGVRETRIVLPDRIKSSKFIVGASGSYTEEDGFSEERGLLPLPPPPP
jgi:hypothetical protein